MSKEINLDSFADRIAEKLLAAKQQANNAGQDVGEEFIEGVVEGIKTHSKEAKSEIAKMFEELNSITNNFKRRKSINNSDWTKVLNLSKELLKSERYADSVAEKLNGISATFKNIGKVSGLEKIIQELDKAENKLESVQWSEAGKNYKKKKTVARKPKAEAPVVSADPTPVVKTEEKKQEAIKETTEAAKESAAALEKLSETSKDISKRMSKNSSIKGIQNLEEEAVSVTRALATMYDDGIRDTEEFITLQYKLSKIFDKIGKRYGGVKGSGAKDLVELRSFIIDRIEQETGTNIFNISGVMEHLMGDSDFSLFNKSLSGLGMQHIADLFYMRKYGVDAMEKLEASTENATDALREQEKASEAASNAQKDLGSTDSIKKQGDAIENVTKKTLNLASVIKRYNKLMIDLGVEDLTIGMRLSQNTDDWGLKEMIQEAKNQLANYYNPEHDSYIKADGLTDDVRKKLQSEVGKLKRFIATYEPYIDMVENTAPAVKSATDAAEGQSKALQEQANAAEKAAKAQEKLQEAYLATRKVYEVKSDNSTQIFPTKEKAESHVKNVRGLGYNASDPAEKRLADVDDELRKSFERIYYSKWAGRTEFELQDGDLSTFIDATAGVKSLENIHKRLSGLQKSGAKYGKIKYTDKLVDTLEQLLNDPDFEIGAKGIELFERIIGQRLSSQERLVDLLERGVETSSSEWSTMAAHYYGADKLGKMRSSYDAESAKQTDALREQTKAAEAATEAKEKASDAQKELDATQNKSGDAVESSVQQNKKLKSSYDGLVEAVEEFVRIKDKQKLHGDDFWELDSLRTAQIGKIRSFIPEGTDANKDIYNYLGYLLNRKEKRTGKSLSAYDILKLIEQKIDEANREISESSQEQLTIEDGLKAKSDAIDDVTKSQDKLDAKSEEASLARQKEIAETEQLIQLLNELSKNKKHTTDDWSSTFAPYTYDLDKKQEALESILEMEKQLQGVDQSRADVKTAQIYLNDEKIKALNSMFRAINNTPFNFHSTDIGRQFLSEAEKETDPLKLIEMWKNAEAAVREYREEEKRALDERRTAQNVDWFNRGVENWADGAKELKAYSELLQQVQSGQLGGQEAFNRFQNAWYKEHPAQIDPARKMVETYEELAAVLKECETLYVNAQKSGSKLPEIPDMNRMRDRILVNQDQYSGRTSGNRFGKELHSSLLNAINSVLMKGESAESVISSVAEMMGIEIPQAIKKAENAQAEFTEETKRSADTAVESKNAVTSGTEQQTEALREQAKAADVVAEAKEKVDSTPQDNSVVENNQRKITSYQELLSVLQEYHRLSNEPLHVDFRDIPGSAHKMGARYKEMEQLADQLYSLLQLSPIDMLDQINAGEGQAVTIGKNLSMLGEIGGPEAVAKNLANIFGFEIPQAIKKAEDAQAEFTAETKETADAQGKLTDNVKDTANVLYHAGDLSNPSGTLKSFPLGNVPPTRSNGIGGLTGLYTTDDLDGFVGNEWQGAPISTIDPSAYKLLSIGTNDIANKVGGFLNDVNATIYGYYNAIDENDWEMKRYTDVKPVEELYEAHKEIFKESSLTFEQFAQFINKSREKIAGKSFADIELPAIDEGIAKSGISSAMQDATDELFNSDSFQTQFLKMLGYEGVDLRGTKYNGTYTGGSVIFDVKPESIKATNEKWSDVMMRNGIEVTEDDLKHEEKRRQLAFDTAKAYSRQAEATKEVTEEQKKQQDTFDITQQGESTTARFVTSAKTIHEALQNMKKALPDDRQSWSAYIDKLLKSESNHPVDMSQRITRSIGNSSEKYSLENLGDGRVAITLSGIRDEIEKTVESASSGKKSLQDVLDIINKMSQDSGDANAFNERHKLLIDQANSGADYDQIYKQLIEDENKYQQELEETARIQRERDGHADAYSEAAENLLSSGYESVSLEDQGRLFVEFGNKIYTEGMSASEAMDQLYMSLEALRKQSESMPDSVVDGWAPEVKKLEDHVNNLGEEFKNSQQYKDHFDSLVEGVKAGSITAAQAMEKMSDAYEEWSNSLIGTSEDQISNALNIQVDKNNPLVANAFKGVGIKGWINKAVQQDARDQLETELYKLAQTLADDDTDSYKAQLSYIADFIVENYRKRANKEANAYEDVFNELVVVFDDEDVAAMGPQLFEKAKAILGKRLQKRTEKNKYFDGIDQLISTLATNHPGLFADPDGSESDYNKLNELLDHYSEWRKDAKRKTTDITLSDADKPYIIDDISTNIAPKMIDNMVESASKLEEQQLSFDGVAKSADKAAKAKERFDRANKKVKQGADLSADSLDEEAESLDDVSRAAANMPDVGEYDRRTIGMDAHGRPFSVSTSTSEIADDARRRTTENYIYDEDARRWDHVGTVQTDDREAKTREMIKALKEYYDIWQKIQKSNPNNLVRMDEINVESSTELARAYERCCELGIEIGNIEEQNNLTAKQRQALLDVELKGRQKIYDIVSQPYQKTVKGERDRLSDIDSNIRRLGNDNVSTGLQEQVAQYRKLVNESAVLMAQLYQNPELSNNVNFSNRFADAANRAKEAGDAIEGVFKASEKLKKIGELITVGKEDVSKVEDLKGAMISFASSTFDGQVKISGFNKTGDQMYATITDANGAVKNITVSLNGVSGHLEAFSTATSRATNEWNNFKKQAADGVKRIASMYLGFNDLIRYGRKGFEYVKEIDLAMTELKKVTDETDASYKRFLNDAGDTAAVIGSTVSDFTNAAAEFARLGYSLEESASMAETAIIYKNVADGLDSVEESSESIISTMMAFGIEANDTMSIVDKFNAVGKYIAQAI